MSGFSRAEKFFVVTFSSRSHFDFPIEKSGGAFHVAAQLTASRARGNAI
jgi:hypothetical protein